MSEALVLYTIYAHPRDFPNSVVVRAWTAENEAIPDPLPCIVGPSVEAVRKVLLERYPNLHCLGREADDEPQIVETWI